MEKNQTNVFAACSTNSKTLLFADKTYKNRTNNRLQKKKKKTNLTSQIPEYFHLNKTLVIHGKPE